MDSRYLHETVDKNNDKHNHQKGDNVHVKLHFVKGLPNCMATQEYIRCQIRAYFQTELLKTVDEIEKKRGLIEVDKV